MKINLLPKYIQAFLMDIQEEAILIPDWLRLKMLRSEVMPATRRLAFAAVRDLEVNQIVLFVQSFGIPVESMNLLLEVSALLFVYLLIFGFLNVC